MVQFTLLYKGVEQTAFVCEMIKTRAWTLCRNLGNDVYWEKGLPREFDVVIRATDEKNTVVGVVLIQEGFRCVISPATGRFECSNNHLDTWFIHLICTSKKHKGLGSKMMEFLKQLAVDKKTIRFLTLAAIEPVITYYWSIHDFKISTDDKEDPHITRVLQQIQQVMKAIREREKTLVDLNSKKKTLRCIIKIQMRNTETQKHTLRHLETSLRNEKKALKTLGVQRSNLFLKIVRTGNYKSFMRSGGFPNRSEITRKAVNKALDGVYMTFCF
jgi:hypothetical protein